MSYSMETLRKAIAAETAAKSGGVIAYRATGAYLAGEVGIRDVVLPETPDDAVAMTLYVLSDLIADGDTIFGLQFRSRARTSSKLDAIEDALMNCWSRRAGGTLDTVKLVQSSWASGASLGQDGNDRKMRSVNFRLTVHRPNPNDNI